MEIRSISDIIAFIKENSIRAYDSNVNALSLYRGQSNYEWSLLPSVYRNNQFRYESIYIKELERIQPSEFAGYDNFSKLVKMQHYGLPTRLLDVTLNPLVALYFACANNYDADGAFYYFSMPTFWQDNWAVQIVADYAVEHLNYMNDLIARERRRRQDYSTSDQKIKESIIHALGVPGHAVLPRSDNRRIQQQSGAFILFGMSFKRCEPNDFPAGYLPYCELDEKHTGIICPVIKKIRIPGQNKKDILDELELLNIHEGYLFPELEYQAQNVAQYVQKRISTI